MRIQVAHAAENALGGMIATAILHQGMKHIDKLPKSIQPPEMKQDPGEFIANKTESLLKLNVSSKVHQALAETAHIGYGAIWPTLLGLVTPEPQNSDIKRVLAGGALLGAGVWAISYIVALPATRITQPLPKQGLNHIASALLSHMVWGIAALLPTLAMQKALARKRYG